MPGHGTVLGRGWGFLLQQSSSLSPLLVWWRATDFFQGLSQDGFKNRITFFCLHVVLLSWVHCFSLRPPHGDCVPLKGPTVCLLLWGGEVGSEMGLREWVRSINAHYMAIFFFLSEKFIGLFLGRVKMFPYQNSHFKAATSRCSWHQND